jgi:hypothetical protein
MEAEAAAAAAAGAPTGAPAGSAAAAAGAVSGGGGVWPAVSAGQATSSGMPSSSQGGSKKVRLKLKGMAGGGPGGQPPQ